MSLYFRFNWIDDGYSHICEGCVNYRGVEQKFYSDKYSNKEFGLLHSKMEVANKIMNSAIVRESMNDSNEFELRPTDSRRMSRIERFGRFETSETTEDEFLSLYPDNSAFSDERHDDDHVGEREPTSVTILDQELDEYMMDI